MRTFLRFALPGLWLVAAIPASGLLLTGIATLLQIEFRVEQAWVQIVLLLVHALAGWLWGRGLAQVTGVGNPGRMGWAGSLGFVLPTIPAAVALTYIELNLGDFLRSGIPVHLLFAVSFGLATLFIAGLAGLGLGLGAGEMQLGFRMALAGGLAGALVFLFLDLLYDLAGFRVGAPGAEERATMLLVSITGMWAVALVASGVFGKILENFTRTSRGGIP